MKKGLKKIFRDEIYSTPPGKSYQTNKMTSDIIDEIWSIDLMDISDYKFSDNEGFCYIFVIVDSFSRYTWCVSPKNKNAQTIPYQFSNIPNSSKRSPVKLEKKRGAEI